ncbi:hypothetical protein JL2886_01865 [Phaeobacter gallaeciensis]|uniref:Uncharacterized protein n=1 Tax=Phaeobacter gallaeciensis TaxID=60890 RepID=A0A1B0ZRH4_9RHOB|nr:hypothetical protein JL2886_01865 [Phaeobacter gallaeciensis]
MPLFQLVSRICVRESASILPYFCTLAGNHSRVLKENPPPGRVFGPELVPEYINRCLLFQHLVGRYTRFRGSGWVNRKPS